PRSEGGVLGGAGEGAGAPPCLPPGPPGLPPGPPELPPGPPPLVPEGPTVVPGTVPAEARRPAASLTGEGEACGGASFAVPSWTFPSVGAEPSSAEGQTLKDDRPTRVTKTIAAPASSAPEAPTPTIRFSDVLGVFLMMAPA